jgi:hypothetical protein
MRATSVRALVWVAMVASLATVRASAGAPPTPAAPDRPDAEMLLELDLLADPRFDRRSSGHGEGASPHEREPLDDFDLESGFDDSKPDSRAPGH